MEYSDEKNHKSRKRKKNLQQDPPTNGARKSNRVSNNRLTEIIQSILTDKSEIIIDDEDGRKIASTSNTEDECQHDESTDYDSDDLPEEQEDTTIGREKFGRYTFFYFTQSGSRHKIYYCSHCNYDTVKIYDFSSHMKTVHEIAEGVLECHECLSCFSCDEEFLFKQHQYRHLREKFSTLAENDGNSASETKDNNKSKCPFGRYIYLQRVNNKIQKVYRCDQCNESKRLITSFANHMKESHGVCDAFECSECTDNFEDYPSFVRHSYFHKNRRNRLQTVEQNEFIVDNADIPREKSTFGLHIYYEVKPSGYRVRLYICRRCDYETTTILNFAHHMMEQHKIKDGFECSECDETFIDNDSFVKHRYQHKLKMRKKHLPESAVRSCDYSPLIYFRLCANGSSRKHYECDQCTFECSKAVVFGAHMLDTHGIIDGYLCHLCCYKTPCPASLQIHVEQHSKLFVNELPVKDDNKLVNGLNHCNNTKYVYNYNHMDGSDIQVYVCNKCDFKHFDISIFADHMASLHEQISNVFECCKCEFTSDNNEDLNAHIIQQHPNGDDESMQHKQVSGSYKCELCGYVSLRNTAYEKHMLRHKDEYCFLCHKCDYRARSKQSLSKHLSIKHNEGTVKSYQCDIEGCQFVSKYKYSLRKHKMSRHQENAYKCESCDYVGSNQGDFLRHVKIHLEMREFQCPFCDFMAYEAQSVRIHMIKHTNVSEFVCPVCKKGFTAATSLKRHIVSHEGIRPWMCSLCKKTYMAKEKLSLHNKSKHGGLAGLIKVCDSKLESTIGRKVSYFSSEVLRVKYGYRERENGTIELYIDGKTKYNEKEVVSLQCDKCNYICRSSNAFVIHKIIKHTEGFRNLPPIVDESRACNMKDNDDSKDITIKV